MIPPVDNLWTANKHNDLPQAMPAACELKPYKLIISDSRNL